MKKLLLTAFVAVAIGASAFADTTNSISYKVRNNFAAEFADAENVTWKLEGAFAKASFIYDEDQMDAFYDSDGDLVASSKAFNFNRLPKVARTEIAKKYSGYTLQECIELTTAIDGDRNFYVSYVNDKEKLVLKVTPTGGVSTFKQVSK